MSSTTSVCPSCGNPVAPGAAFCGSCGASLQQRPGFHAAADLDGASKRPVPSGSSAPAGGNSGYSAPAGGNSGYSAPAGGNSGYSAPAGGNSGYSAPAGGNSGYSAPAGGNSGYSAPAGGNSGYSAPAGSNSGYSAPAGGNSGYSAPAGGNSGYSAPAGGNSGYSAPAGGNSGYSAPAGGNSGYSAPAGGNSGYSAPAGYNSGYSAGSHSAVPPVYQPPTPPTPPAAFGSRRIHEVLGSGCSLCLAILNTIPILGVVFVLFQLMMGQFSYSFLDSFFYAAPRLTTASSAVPPYLDPGTLLYSASMTIIIMLLLSLPTILTCIAYWSCYACGRSGKRSTGGLTIFSGLFIYNIVIVSIAAGIIGLSLIAKMISGFELLKWSNEAGTAYIVSSLIGMLIAALIFSLIFKYFIQFRKTATSIRSILQKGSGRAYVGTFSLVMLYIKAILFCLGVLVLFVLVIAGADLLDLSPVAALLLLTVVLLPSMLSAIVPIVLLHRLQTNGGLWIA